MSVSVSPHKEKACLLDKNDKPLGYAICPRTAGRWKSFVAGRKMASRKSLPVDPQTLWTGHPVSLLRWLKEHEPERYAQIGCVMTYARLPALVFNRRQRL
ncbi:FGGY family carbohydrate kinase [Escherichia coli]